MKLHSLLFCFLFLFNGPLANAQYSSDGQHAKNSLSIETVSNSYFTSVNYSRHLLRSPKKIIGVRAGLGAAFSLLKKQEEEHEQYNNVVFSTSIPIEVFALWGSGNHKLETGVGVYSLVAAYVFGPSFDPFITMGYRYQPIDRRLFIKTALQLQQGFESGKGMKPWLQVGIGYQF